MKLLIDNKEVPFSTISSNEGIEQYYASFDIVLPCHLDTDVFTLSDNGSVDQYHVVRQMFYGNSYTYTAVPKATFDLLSSTCDAFEGTATLKQLLSKLGIPNNISVDSVPTYWRIPSCKISSLFSYLSDYTELTSGGAPRFFIDLSGKVNCIDLKAVLALGPRQDLIADPASDSYSIESATLLDPGRVKAIVYKPTGTSTLYWNFKRGYGSTTITVNDTTGHEAELMHKRMHNRFYSKYFSARKITIPVVLSSVSLGSCVSLNGVGSFVVTFRKLTFDMSDSAPTLSINLSSNYENN